MDLSAFQYFLSVAQLRSFSEAAYENHISQSSLSKAILRLEDELNIQLIDRKHHPIALTDAGTSLRDSLLKLRPMYETAIRELDYYRGHHTIRCYFVPRLYATRSVAVEFLSHNRDIELILQDNYNQVTAVEDMIDGDYDMGIMHRPFNLSDGIRMTELYDDNLYVVLPQDDPLAEQDMIQMETLSGYTFIESKFSAAVVAALSQEFNFRPKNIIVHADDKLTTSTKEEVLLRIARGDGIGIFCQRDITVYNLSSVHLVRRRIREVPEYPIVLLEREGRTDTEWHQRFCSFLKENQEKYAAPSSAYNE